MSPIYQNIHVYRLIMNLLYLGRYNKRFQKIIKFIEINNTKKIVELAFGDVQIAKWAKSNDIKWTGFDINKSFVSYAKAKGYDAFEKDIKSESNIPESDLTIISGSLYHFHEFLEKLINKIMSKTKILIISEPIQNISSKKNIFGKIAKRSANISTEREEFRYNENTLIETLDRICIEKYKIETLEKYSKDIIIRISHDQI